MTDTGKSADGATLSAHDAETFRLLVSGIRDYAIFTLDLDGIVTSWNVGARQMKGYEPDEIIGSHFSRFYTPEVVQLGWPQRELAVAKEEGRFEDESWRVRKDGTHFWANVVITAIRSPAGALVGYSKITRDLTERRRREEALSQSEERLRKHGEALEDAMRRMREFIAMLSHELRNSLAPIRNAASLLAQKKLDSTIVENLGQTIDRQSAVLTRLVDDLFDINRIERGHFTIEREPVLLADVLSRAIEASRPLIETRCHALQTQWPKERIRLLGDMVRLTQVFTNILNNAARYTPVGGHIRVGVETSGAAVTVHVADTGKGIAPELLGRVFDPFTRLEPRDTDAEGGLGVGLALVQRIVALHGGRVEARSEGIDRGSEFVVTLPLMEDATRPTPEIPEERPVCAVRILCVDDNREVVNSLAKLLEAKGHKTQVAYDGAEALRVAPIFRPQMVLLDIDMPGMSGHELASRLRELQLDPPPMLVALTGWGRDTDKRRAEQAGFHRYLVKPATLETLECLLASIAPDPTRCCSS